MRISLLSASESQQRAQPSFYLETIMQDTYWQDMRQAAMLVMESAAKDPAMLTIAWNYYAPFLSYRAYLKSDGWRKRSEAAKEAAGHRCQVCNGKDALNTHHRTYANIGHEKPEDLTVLCHKCHGLYSKDKINASPC